PAEGGRKCRRVEEAEDAPVRLRIAAKRERDKVRPSEASSVVDESVEQLARDRLSTVRGRAKYFDLAASFDAEVREPHAQVEVGLDRDAAHEKGREQRCEGHGLDKGFESETPDVEVRIGHERFEMLATERPDV